MSYFEKFDLDGFWKDSDYARKEYVLEPPTDSSIAAVERKLGYKLPGSYIELMRHQNGGFLKKTLFATTEPTSCAEDRVQCDGIMGIGSSKTFSLCGELGSQFREDMWDYPKIGIYFGTTPSAGHDMICMDYRKCGPNGEPQIVHVDQEFDFKITFLANTFEDFIKSLRSSEDFED